MGGVAHLDGRRALPPPLPPPLLQWVAVLSAQSLPRRPAPQPGQLPADLKWEWGMGGGAKGGRGGSR